MEEDKKDDENVEVQKVDLDKEDIKEGEEMK